MTPIKPGTSRRLGLRRKQHRVLERARRQELGGVSVWTDQYGGSRVTQTYEWFGSANGIAARFITTNPDLALYVEPLCDGHTQGVALVDQHGHRQAFQVARLWG